MANSNTTKILGQLGATGRLTPNKTAEKEVSSAAPTNLFAQKAPRAETSCLMLYSTTTNVAEHVLPLYKNGSMKQIFESQERGEHSIVVASNMVGAIRQLVELRQSGLHIKEDAVFLRASCGAEDLKRCIGQKDFSGVTLTNANEALMEDIEQTRSSRFTVSPR